MKLNNKYISLLDYKNELYFNGIILKFDDELNYIGLYSNCFDENTTGYIASKIKEILKEEGILNESNRFIK